MKLSKLTLVQKALESKGFDVKFNHVGEIRINEIGQKNIKASNTINAYKNGLHIIVSHTDGGKFFNVMVSLNGEHISNREVNGEHMLVYKQADALEFIENAIEYVAKIEKSDDEKALDISTQTQSVIEDVKNAFGEQIQIKNAIRSKNSEYVSFDIHTTGVVVVVNVKVFLNMVEINGVQYDINNMSYALGVLENRLGLKVLDTTPKEIDGGDFEYIKTQAEKLKFDGATVTVSKILTNENGENYIKLRVKGAIASYDDMLGGFLDNAITFTKVDGGYYCEWLFNDMATDFETLSTIEKAWKWSCPELLGGE